MAGEDSEARRYTYTKRKKDEDEASEGKRHSYKPNPKAPRSRVMTKAAVDKPANRKPLKQRIPHGLETVDRNDRDDTRDRARRPVRGIREKVGDVRPKRIPDQPKRDRGDEGNAAKITKREREINEALRRGWEQSSRDKGRDRIYADLPRPIIKRERPEGGPSPMIQPQVGPVGELRSKVAHTYGLTPEAYKDLRNTSVRAAPPADDYEKTLGGYYAGPSGGIYLNTDPEWGIGAMAPTLAHEQAHAMFEERGYVTPPNAKGDAKRFGADLDTPQGQPPADQYRDDMARWRTESTLPNGKPYPTVGREATNAMWNDAEVSGLYPDRNAWPTETYARSIEVAPDPDRSDWPDYIRPYYSGYLQGMDKLSTGEPTPPVPNAEPPFVPGQDENGLWGSPLPQYRRNW